MRLGFGERAGWPGADRRFGRLVKAAIFSLVSNLFFNTINENHQKKLILAL
jgi:hypothetical protein